MIVSVVTPTLNSARWIETCIASVKMQAGPGIEVEHVVADGGSTDGTYDIAAAAGCTMAPAGDDQGIFDAVNKATAISSGRLVGFLGSDDVLFPGALRSLAAAYVRSGRRWVTGSYRWADEHFRPLGDIAAPPTWLTAELQASLGWSYPLHMASYVERSLFDELGGFDLAYPIAADYKFFTEAMRIAPFARVPHLVALFRRHGSNFSMVDPGAEELAQIRDDYGPDGRLKRELYRWGIKTWVNARNPRWAYLKRFPPAPLTDLAAPSDRPRTED